MTSWFILSQEFLQDLQDRRIYRVAVLVSYPTEYYCLWGSMYKIQVENSKDVDSSFPFQCLFFCNVVLATFLYSCLSLPRNLDYRWVPLVPASDCQHRLYHGLAVWLTENDFTPLSLKFTRGKNENHNIRLCALWINCAKQYFLKFREFFFSFTREKVSLQEHEDSSHLSREIYREGGKLYTSAVCVGPFWWISV